MGISRPRVIQLGDKASWPRLGAGNGWRLPPPPISRRGDRHGTSEGLPRNCGHATICGCLVARSLALSVAGCTRRRSPRAGLPVRRSCSRRFAAPQRMTVSIVASLCQRYSTAPKRFSAVVSSMSAAVRLTRIGRMFGCPLLGDLRHGHRPQPKLSDQTRGGVQDGVAHRLPVRLDRLGPKLSVDRTPSVPVVPVSN